MLLRASEKLLRTLLKHHLGHHLGQRGPLALGPKLRSPPGGSWADHARWAMCPDGLLGPLFPKPAPRILNRDPTLARPCIADNGHRMDFALPRQAMEPPWALIDGPS